MPDYLLQQGIETSFKLLGAKGKPICLTDLLHDRMHNLAAAFLHDVSAVRLLLGLKIANTKIKDIPGKGQVTVEMAFIL